MTTLRNSRTFSIVFYLLFAFFIPYSAYTQPGCKDPYANNYNPSATTNDGSCIYNITSYTPQVKVNPLSSTLVETSGLQMAGNFLWSFNDGGGEAAIYRIDTTSNNILQTVNLSGATNIDWEDIAFDGTYFYIGDFGNNLNGARTDLKIYKFPFSAIPDYTTNPLTSVAANQIEVISFIYADQTQPPATTTANNTKFDCEAMIVDGGKIHLFTKNWIDVNTTHYVIASTQAGIYTALPVETLATTYLVTGADKAVGQERVILLGYQASGVANHFIHLLSDYNTSLYFNGNKRRIDLPNVLTMGQAEGITFRNSSYGYISNERVSPLSVNPKLHSFNITNFISSQVLPLELNSFKVEKTNRAHKIIWNFSSPVQDLLIQYRNNGANFSDLKGFNTSTADVFYNEAISAINCYRLAWRKNNSVVRYSNTVCLNDEQRNSIKNASLNSKGELHLLIDGAHVEYQALQLVSTDGRLLFQTSNRVYSPGLNKVISKRSFPVGTVVYLVIHNKAGKQTKLLKVEN